MTDNGGSDIHKHVITRMDLISVPVCSIKAELTRPINGHLCSSELGTYITTTLACSNHSFMYC